MTRQERTAALRDLQEADLVLDPQNPAHQTPRHFSDPYPGFHPSEPLLFSSSTGSRRLFDPDEETSTGRKIREAMESWSPEQRAWAAAHPIRWEIDFSGIEDPWERYRLRDKIIKLAQLKRRLELEALGSQLLARARARLNEPKRVSIARAIIVDSTRSDRDIAREYEVSPTTVGSIRGKLDTQTA